jgi:hypothetical protein
VTRIDQIWMVDTAGTDTLVFRPVLQRQEE